MLNLNSLEYEYKRKKVSNHVLKGINYTFERGQIYAITGASGSGKSTLLSLLAGLDNPTKGSITYKDRNLGAEGHISHVLSPSMSSRPLGWSKKKRR